MTTETVHTNCSICLSSCGINVEVDREANRVLRIEPDKQNPYTWRDFCSRGRTANELVEHPNRILRPMKRVDNRYVEVDHDTAVGEIAAGLNDIIDRHGPDAVASYFGNPAGFSQANAIMFPGLLDAIGTQNRYWFGSTDNNNVHIVGHEMFGSPLVALTTDIDECDYFLFIGTNPAVSGLNWLHNSPDGWRRVQQRRAAGAELVVVDPRRTKTADAADLHLPVRSGQDWALLLGLVKIVLDKGWDQPSVVPERGREELRQLVGEIDLDDLANRCGIAAWTLTDVAQGFAQSRTSMCFGATGISQTVHGTIGEWLVNVLNSICNRIDVPGGRRFERGVADLIKIFDMIAPDSDHVSRLAGRPTVAGFHTLGELPDEITTPGTGQVRALLMHAGNPVVSGPDGGRLDAALAGLELFVAHDLVQRESHRHAHWLIPDVHWLERRELHVLFAGLQEEPFIQYHDRAVNPPEGVRPSWEFFVDLCLAMNRNLFGKPGVNRLIRASRALAVRSGRPGLAFGPNWVEHALVRSGRRVRMKDVRSHPHGWRWSEKRYGDLAETIRTDDRKIRLDVPIFVGEVRRLLAEPAPRPPADRPFVLSNRRHKDMMNSWLVELPGLHTRKRHNDLEIHPDDAAALNVTDGDTVRVSSETGDFMLPATLTDRVSRGVVATHHGFGSAVYDPSQGQARVVHGANRNLVIAGDHIDRFSQTSGLNDTHVAVERVTPASPTERPA